MISSFVNQQKNTKYILQFLYSLRRLKPSFLHFFCFFFFRLPARNQLYIQGIHCCNLMVKLEYAMSLIKPAFLYMHYACVCSDMSKQVVFSNSSVTIRL